MFYGCEADCIAEKWELLRQQSSDLATPRQLYMSKLWGKLSCQSGQATIASRQHMEEMEIAQDHYQAILAHLTTAYPLEGCGLLAGKNGRVTAVYPITNILHSPTAYEMEPLQQIQTILQIEQNNEDLLAIYHSHPNGPSTPSSTDITAAYYPDSIYLIISLADLTVPQMRAFRIVDGAVSELNVRIG